MENHADDNNILHDDYHHHGDEQVPSQADEEAPSPLIAPSTLSEKHNLAEEFYEEQVDDYDVEDYLDDDSSPSLKEEENHISTTSTDTATDADTTTTSSSSSSSLHSIEQQEVIRKENLEYSEDTTTTNEGSVPVMNTSPQESMSEPKTQTTVVDKNLNPTDQDNNADDESTEDSPSTASPETFPEVREVNRRVVHSSAARDSASKRNDKDLANPTEATGGVEEEKDAVNSSADPETQEQESSSDPIIAESKVEDEIAREAHQSQEPASNRGKRSDDNPESPLSQTNNEPLTIYDTHDDEEDDSHVESSSESKEQQMEEEADDKPKKEGSLASFFEKVSKKEKENQSKGALSSSFEAANEFHRSLQPPPLDDNYPYCGVWGKYQPERRRADLSILFHLFQDLLYAELDKYSINENEKLEIMNEMVEKLSNEAEEAGTILPPSKPERSSSVGDVNTDFVEGLDDIDALFEGVDPPDELDVGASGSSIQEVIMGQGRLILWKNVQRGKVALIRAWDQSRDAVKEQVQRFVAWAKQIEREDIERVIHSIWEHCKAVYDKIQELVDRIMEGNEDDEDEDSPSFDFSDDGEGLGSDNSGAEELERVRQLLQKNNV